MKQQKQQKYHLRIHQVIHERKQNPKSQQYLQVESKYLKSNLKNEKSLTPTMEHSQVLSQNQTSSVILPRSNVNQLEIKNFYQIQNQVGSSCLNSQRSKSKVNQRQIKSARPVLRRKITSKDKYSKTIYQKQQPSKFQPKKSQIFQQLQILQPDFFIIQKDDRIFVGKEGELRALKAFWSKQHLFVSLFPLQYTECIKYNHANILPVYGQVKLSEKRYVVSNQYKNSSLKDLIKQFGAFQQRLCKYYLYQIICGLEQMHNKKMAHNRLSCESILYDKEGQVFINVVKSTSRPLSHKQKQQRLFEYSPQILLQKNKSNSLRNDIWSIGIILLDMLFDFEKIKPQNMSFHPYQVNEKQVNQNDGIIIDNLKQLYPNRFIQNRNKQLQNLSIQRYKKLSKQAKDIIRKCLVLNKDDRISLKELKQHKFFIK